MIKCRWLTVVALGLLPLSCSAQNKPNPVPVPTAPPVNTNTPQLDTWLKTHNPNSFTGKTWARFRILTPQDYQYAVIVDSETNPYKPERTSTGTVWATGLQPKPWTDPNDWGKPLPWVAPATDGDWLRAGQYSMWVELPVSKSAQWHTAFVVRPKDNNLTRQVTLNLEFATSPSANDIFYLDAEPIDEKGTVLVRMPTMGGLDGLRMVAGFTDWAKRRRQAVVALNIPPAPRANRIRIGTWTTSYNYRAPGTAGSSTREQAEPDFQTLADLGLNSVSPAGLNQKLFGELAQKYGMIDSTITGWTTLWRNTPEDRSGQYNYQPGETPAQRWKRVFDDFYGKLAARYKIQIPTTIALAEHLNLGDEPHPLTRATEINSTPDLLAYFRTWLAEQGAGDPNWTPQLFGANNWNAVEPLDDRNLADRSAADPVIMHRYYWTWQFINEYAVIYYKAATTAVRKHFPKVKIITVNYQSGPVQNGFIGQNNTMPHGNIDIFEIGRQGAMQGVMMEDWVASTDIGAGFTSFGADVMRAAARKQNLPMAAYIVGNVPRPRFYAWMMQGVKEFGMYLYGPISTIGPAWSDEMNTVRQISQLTREVQKFETEIATAQMRPTKAALLVANTSDIMQRNGMYFASERQQLYLALRHSGVPVDLVSEQDIVDDNILNQYSLLYVSDPQVRNDVQRKIAAWVQNGGKLHAQVGAMNFDEYSQPSAIMNPVLGVGQNTANMQPGNFRWGTLNVFSPRIGKFAFTPQGKVRVAQTSITPATEITAWGMRLEATPTTGRVIGTYDNGQPAVILNSYGRGTALLVGALTGEAYVRERYTNTYPVQDNGNTKGIDERQIATALVSNAGVAKPVELSVPGIYTSVMDAPASTLVFFNKAFDAPVGTVTVRIPNPGGVSAVDSTKLGRLQHQINGGVLTVQLPLQDSDILRISR